MHRSYNVKRIRDNRSALSSLETKKLSREMIIRGQGTIFLTQKNAHPFKIQLSNCDNPNSKSAFTITLQVFRKQTILSLNNIVFRMSNNAEHIIQPYDEQWHRYWLSISKDDLSIKYGIGEARPYFSIFDVIVNEEKEYLKTINFVQVCLDSYRSEHCQIHIEKLSVIQEPQLLISSHSLKCISDIYKSQTTLVTNLSLECQHLYANFSNFELNEENFPEFKTAIDFSVKSPNGLCNRKLHEKAIRNHGMDKCSTYLRVTIGEKDGTAPGHSCVLEIWPPKHCSAIHNHASAHGIIKVLYGEVLVHIYPELSENIHKFPSIKKILKENQITWMSPSLNQTHQIINPDTHSNTSITLQCYRYGSEDAQHYEYFDYKRSINSIIGNFEPKSDFDYLEFRQSIKAEWEYHKGPNSRKS